MNTKLLASALGALMVESSALALADGRNAGAIERSVHQVRGDHGWRPDHRRRDWERGHRNWERGHRNWDRGHRDWRGDGHYGDRGHHRGHSHYKPYRHHYYQPHRHHGGWQPRGYDRDGVTIIFRGSFY